MENKDSKRLLVMITNSFAALNVIHSGLIAHLARRFEIHILTNLIGLDEIRAINSHFGINVKLADMTLPRENGRLKLLRKIEKALFFQHFDIQTEKIKNLSDHRVWAKTYRQFISFLSWIKVDLPLLRFVRKLIISISGRPDGKAPSYLDQFAAFISTSPLDIRENIVVNLSKRSIPSIAMVISWDNLTSKGLINADHNLVFVWNKIMVNEYLHLYNPFQILNSIVKPVGIPRFDTHFETGSTRQSEDLFRRNFGLDSADKIILFATSATKHFPTQAEILEHLSEYATKHQNVRILVRVHPFDDLKNYHKFAVNPKIRFSVPETLRNGTLPGIPALDNLSSLTHILKNVNVCIHTASTIQLDALACGTPVIDIAYDGDSVMPYARSVRRLYDYSHQKNIPKDFEGKKVYSKKQLYHLLDQTLDKLVMNSNSISLKAFTHFDQPKSVDTIRKHILEWLG